MKVEDLRPNIVRIAFHQEPGDPHYGSCLWAYYDFDLDRYMLNIQSDCGNAAYRWVETPNSETFLHLMTRVNDGYLMEKLFGEPDEADIDDTIGEVRERLGIGNDEDYKLDLDENEVTARENMLADLSERLNDFASVSLSENVAENILFEWNADSKADIDEIWECVVTDYTAWQYRIAEIFRDHVQPKIKRLLESW